MRNMCKRGSRKIFLEYMCMIFHYGNKPLWARRKCDNTCARGYSCDDLGIFQRDAMPDAETMVRNDWISYWMNVAQLLLDYDNCLAAEQQ